MRVENNCRTNENFSFKFFLKTKWCLLLFVSFLVAGCAFLAFYDQFVFFVFLPVAIFLTVYDIVVLINYDKEQNVLIARLLGEFVTDSECDFRDFPIPVLACSHDGIVLWINDCFDKNINKNNKYHRGLNFLDVIKEPLDDFCSRSGVQVRLSDRDFKVHATCSKKSGIYILYFEENTNFVFFAREYRQSRPAVMYIKIDNYDEFLAGKKESEKSNIIGKVDDIIEKFIDESRGFIQKIEDYEFLVVVEQRDLERMVSEKFEILKSVKDVTFNGKGSLTLSVGVASIGETFGQNQKFAKQALDMALGRGGDQVALKNATSFEFFGGNSKDVEKRTRVKARIVANALLELVGESDNVIIMGHKFGDLDSLGSAIGLASAVRKFNKESFVAIDPAKNLVSGLLEKIKESDLADIILDVDDALDLIYKKTLLVIVDTHNPDFVESKEIYKRCNQVVVIDHHRKMVNYINDAVIFYHEPYASSTSELVCELIQYFGDECVLGSVEAEAMLSGIMLDTKNFVLKVGVRTFEAAAYLKSLGADTVSVRKLFSNTIESYQKRVRIVSNAEIYRGCAIAISEFKTQDMRTISPQAADELLEISGVEASFVIYQIGSVINITARSLGNFNVQVVMERLGGGGHQSQAACQIKDSNIESTRQMLLQAIDENGLEQ